MTKTTALATEHKGFQYIQEKLGGLATITDAKLAVISKNMMEVDRANNSVGRSETQTTNQLMTLTMLSDSPYRQLKQCLAQIDSTRSALDETYYRMLKTQVKIAECYEKGDPLSIIEAQEAEHGVVRSKSRIDGAFKEIAIFQTAYSEIRASHNIPEAWDEMDAELAEIDHHIKQAFRQAHRDMISTGRIGIGNMEYLEQFGIHPQTATKIVGDYIAEENKEIEAGRAPTVLRLYNFLDSMAVMFHDAHKQVMDRIGIKELIKKDFLYLESTATER